MALKLIRWVLSQIVLFLDWLTAPRPQVRSVAEQLRVDQQCAGLALYQFVGCPFCVKVRRQIRKLALKIELRDAQKDPVHRETLVREGGMLQVPCLLIPPAESGQKARWLYESTDINAWLEERFGVRP
ncbi:MAG: glutaredoxin family protein [Oligoflexia bacterium]|jgi:glutaredoxin